MDDRRYPGEVDVEAQDLEVDEGQSDGSEEPVPEPLLNYPLPPLQANVREGLDRELLVEQAEGSAQQQGAQSRGQEQKHHPHQDYGFDESPLHQ